MRTPLKGIVLAGGKGTRLRDFTRELTGELLPKQFCAFGEARPLLCTTLDRLTRVTRDVTAIVPSSHVRTARQLAGEHRCTFVTQPRDRGTGPGLLVPLHHALRDKPDAVVIVTPADHGVANDAAFAAGVLAANDVVASGGAPIVLCGVTADAARTDYGWIVPGAPLGDGLRDVVRFVEKPPPAEAERLLAEGALWNTMVLVARGAALLELFWEARPDWARVFDEAALLEPAAREQWLARAYDRLAPCDFSHDVLSPARGLAVQAWPTSIGWSDLGTPERMRAWLDAHAAPEAQSSLG